MLQASHPIPTFGYVNCMIQVPLEALSLHSEGRGPWLPNEGLSPTCG